MKTQVYSQVYKICMDDLQDPEAKSVCRENARIEAEKIGKPTVYSRVYEDCMRGLGQEEGVNPNPDIYFLNACQKHATEEAKKAEKATEEAEKARRSATKMWSFSLFSGFGGVPNGDSVSDLHVGGAMTTGKILSFRAEGVLKHSWNARMMNYGVRLHGSKPNHLFLQLGQREQNDRCQTEFSAGVHLKEEASPLFVEARAYSLEDRTFGLGVLFGMEVKF